MINQTRRLLISGGVWASGLLALTSSPAAAQSAGKPGGKTAAGHPKTPAALPDASPAPVSNETVTARVTALTTNMVQALDLNPAQAEKVRVINANSVRNVEAARQRYADTPAKLRGTIEDIGLARLEQLKDVLTPAQFNRYQQKREQKLGIPPVRGYQGTPPPGMGGGRGDE